MKNYGQSVCDGFIYGATDYDIYLGSYDTLCAGDCQYFWITNADCPEFRDIGFHWVFYGINKNDTLFGDTVYYCYPDTGIFLFYVYASNFSLDSAYSSSRNVILPCPPTANFTANRPIICVNQSVTFTDSSKRLVNNWQWTFEGGTPATYNGQHPPPVFYSDTGYYYVQLAVSSPYGSDNVVKANYIQVLPGPQPVAVQNEFQIKEGDEVTLTACARGSTYQWQPSVAVLQNEDTLLSVQPENTQNYSCTVATANGCTTMCSYEVKVQSGLLLPTAFSPNGDGINDVFRILNTNITLKNFEIYNRWGELVFKTSDIQSGWNGIYKGVEQAAGVYVWYADYIVTKSGKRKSAMGNVTLLR